MTGRYGITIIEGDASSRFANDFHSSRQTAEWAFFPLNAWELVEMVILVEFITLVSNDALKRQSDITLISILFVDRMKPKAFFRQISTNRKIGSTLWQEQICYIHHHFCLGIWFKDIQDIVADYGVKLALREVGTVIIVVTSYIIALSLQFVRVKSKAATEVQDPPIQQIMLKQISGRNR